MVQTYFLVQPDNIPIISTIQFLLIMTIHVCKILLKNVTKSDLCIP